MTIAASAPSPPSHQGERVEIVGVPGKRITLAADEAAYASYRGGRGGKSGKELFGVAVAELAEIVRAAGDRTLVRVVGGRWAGREGWIAPEELRPVPSEEELRSGQVGGLSLGRRREIYASLHQVGLKASEGAYARFPLSAVPDEGGAAYIAAHQAAFKRALSKGRSKLVGSYKVEGKTLDRIQAEGDEKRWPLSGN